MGEKKTIKVRLGEKDYQLRFSLQAVSDLGDEYGLTFANLSQEALQELPVSALQKALWFLLRVDHPDMEYEDVGKAVDQTNAAEVVQAFFELLAGTSGGLADTVGDSIRHIREATRTPENGPEERAAIAS